MTNLFKKAAGNVGHMLLIVWPLAVVLCIVALSLMVEDYDTSRLGYLALPTQKVNSDWIPSAVALLPQLSQIVLFYIFGRDTRKVWPALIASGFFIVDIGTDTWYKSGGDWQLMPLAFTESLLIFTLGSEILFTIAAGFLMESFGDFIVVLTAFLKSVMDGIGKALDTVGLSVKDDDDYDRPIPVNINRKRG